jgi:hypothetical protein
MVQSATDNLLAALAGKIPPNCLNPDSITNHH